MSLQNRTAERRGQAKRLCVTSVTRLLLTCLLWCSRYLNCFKTRLFVTLFTRFVALFPPPSFCVSSLYVKKEERSKNFFSQCYWLKNHAPFFHLSEVSNSKANSPYVRIFPGLGTGCYGNWKQLYLTDAITSRAFPLTWPKEGFPYILVRKWFNSHRTGLEHQHGRRFIVLRYQYGGLDFM